MSKGKVSWPPIAATPMAVDRVCDPFFSSGSPLEHMQQRLLALIGRTALDCQCTGGDGPPPSIKPLASGSDSSADTVTRGIDPGRIFSQCT